MGSQLRFDPSFFGLVLRAAAEADASLFSAHGDLSGIGRPARAGLRLTSPAKASGERGGGESGHAKTPTKIQRGGSSRRASRSAPVTRAPPSGFSPRLAHRVPHVIHPRRRRGNGAAPGNGFLGKERIPDVRDACGEGRKGVKKARRAFYPIARRCFFGRRA